MIQQIFQPKGQTFKDWDKQKLNSVRDELDQYIAMAMEQQQREAIVRIKPEAKAYYVDIETAYTPKCSRELERAFRQAVAKRWYRPLKKTD